MKKFLLIPLLLLSLLFLASCDIDECKHLKTTEKITAPTCTGEGYTTRTCRTCGYKYNFNYIAPLGHTIKTSTVAPDCTEEGYTSYKCEDCDYEFNSDFVEPTGHKFTSSITESTCTEGGYTTYTCACGYYYKTKFTVPNGHHLTGSITKPTCTAEGYTTYSCICGYSFKADVKEPTGHDFKKAITRPTIATTGATTYTCRVCDFKYSTDYVWYSEIFSGAEGDGEGVLAYGIDISYYNKDVDFEALKADGIDFVIIRAGSIYQNPDNMFESHYKKAKAAGLDVGAYFYTYADSVNDIKNEVEILLDILDGKQFEYPIYFDMEEEFHKDLPVSLKMDMCRTFCELLIENGYFPGIYSGLNFLKDNYFEEETLTYYDIWVARYPYVDYNYDYTVYDYSDTYGMWQYTDRGSIDGIKGNVDLNVAYKDYPAIIKKYGYNGY